KAIVVGLYRVPSSSKIFLLNQLKQKLEHNWFTFFNSSKVIATIVPSSLNVF
ncbi:hypothetical protein P154DRAFT_421927, partial [Amniculicola lignicola CBS 123094]